MGFSGGGGGSLTPPVTFTQDKSGDNVLTILGRPDASFSDILLAVTSQRNPRSFTIIDGTGANSPGYFSAASSNGAAAWPNVGGGVGNLFNNVGFMFGAVSDIVGPTYVSYFPRSQGSWHASLFSADVVGDPAFEGFRITGDASPALEWADGAGSALDTALKRVAAGSLECNGGLGMFGVAPPAAKPATPATLANVIALLQSYGMCT